MNEQAVTCVRAGCSGTYGAEGYCDECGRKAPTGVLGRLPSTAQPSASGVAASGSVATRTSGRTGSRTSGRSRSGRGGLGAGLIDLPRVPLRDPATAVMKDPKVAEARRFCVTCDQPVGRGRADRAGRDEGFCPACGTPFSFLPRLGPGDIVDGRYELLGALAYGGLGWIYLARDRNVSDTVSDRWVVLKGLINTNDADAMAAAVTERRFLVEIDHPNIVKIHDFVEHPDARTGVPIGYIVMEYVGGQSLRDVLQRRRAETGERGLPLADVLAYGAEILPAIGYLHDRDLLFCDFKPDNVIHAEEQLKLIDLGAVRLVDDDESAIYGTPGYQAPEVARTGPTVASDIYTIGRTLAVLSFEFRHFTTRYAECLPDRSEVPLLAREESFFRLLRRATHPDPARRFETAAEMAEQTLGVLREVVSAADGVARPAMSHRFTPERTAFGAGAGQVETTPAPAQLQPADVAQALPLPQVDVLDSGAGFLATLSTSDPAELVRQLEHAPVSSHEVSLRLIRARVERGDLAGAWADLDALTATDPYEWRLDWYRGLTALAADRPGDARVAFDAVYDVLPGEPSARLALAAAAECTDDAETAGRLYDRVWRVDRGFISGAFGLARLRLGAGDREAALTVLDQVPDSSRHHVVAQVAAIRAGLTGVGQRQRATDLLTAAQRLERLTLDVERQARLTVETLEAALGWVRAGQATTRRLPPRARLLGNDFSERGLRFGLERAYRTLARLARDPESRIDLVDRANAVRPRTLV
jgi:serine/threonine-protein kinase PknG